MDPCPRRSRSIGLDDGAPLPELRPRYSTSAGGSRKDGSGWWRRTGALWRFPDCGKRTHIDGGRGVVPCPRPCNTPRGAGSVRGAVVVVGTLSKNPASLQLRYLQTPSELRVGSVVDSGHPRCRSASSCCFCGTRTDCRASLTVSLRAAEGSSGLLRTGRTVRRPRPRLPALSRAGSAQKVTWIFLPDGQVDGQLVRSRRLGGEPLQSLLRERRGGDLSGVDVLRDMRSEALA